MLYKYFKLLINIFLIKSINTINYYKTNIDLIIFIDKIFKCLNKNKINNKFLFLILYLLYK